MDGAWPLIRRDDEVERAVAAVGRGGAVLAGPNGSGLSRLLDEVEVRLADSGRATRRVRGSRALAARPYAALAPILGDAVPDGADAARAVLAAVLAHPGAVLVVDDAQSLDDASAATLLQAADGRGIALLVALHTDEPVPEPVTALWKDGFLERVEVEPLDPDERGRLVQAALGGECDGDLIRHLVTRAGSSLVLLRELTRSGLDSGAVVEQEGLWRLTGPVPVSARLVEVIGERLDEVDGRARDAIELVALGEPLLVGAATKLVDPDLLDAIERRGRFRIDASRGGHLRLRSAIPLLGEVVRASLPTIRARTLRVALADAIDAAAAEAGRRGTGRDRMLAARLRLEAGVPIGAEAGIDAARVAWRAFDFALARQLAEAAVAAGGGFEAELILAQTLGQLGLGDASDAALEQLEQVAADDRERATVVATRSENLVFRLGDTERALAVLEAGEASIGDERILAELASKRALLLHAQGRSTEALAIAQPILEHLEGENLLAACFVVATAATLTGEIDVSLHACELGASAELEPTSPWDPAILQLTHVAAVSHHDLRAGFAMAEERYEQALREGSRHRQGWFAWVRGGLSLTAGKPASAVRWCREGLEALRELGQASSMQLVQYDLARGLALLGRVDEAREHAAAADVATADPGGSLFGGEGARLMAHAWVTAAAGDHDAARRLAQQGAERHRAEGNLVAVLHALLDVARLGGRPDTALAAELVGRVQGREVAAYADLVADWSGRGKPTRIEAAAEALEAQGEELVAAEAFALAAARWERLGDHRAAAAADRRAAAALARCEGAVTPASRLREVRPVLSPRELEVATLAGGGLSNKAIAEQLVLSVRTVETLLQRSYQKLGIESRAGLGEALGL